MEPLIAARAKEKQKAGGGSGPSGRQKSAQPSKTREEAAALAGVSHDTGRRFYVEVYTEKPLDMTAQTRRFGSVIDN